MSIESSISSGGSSRSDFYKKEFSYTGFSELKFIWLRMGGVLTLLLTGILIPGFFIFAFLHGEGREVWQCSLIVGAWSMALGFVGGAQFLTYAPNIWVGDKGLVVSFFYARVELPWSEILDVRQKSKLFDTYRVRVRHLTPIHRVLGLVDGQGPNFIIDSGMPERDELVRLIRRGIGDW